MLSMLGTLGSSSRQDVVSIANMFCTTESVDSIYHVIAFVVTHPTYMAEALKALKMKKVPITQVLSFCKENTDDSDINEVIHKSSSGMIVMLMLFLLIQIIALFAFIFR